MNVKVVGGINDDKIIAALRAGNAPDVVSSFTSIERRHLLPVRRLDRSRARTSSRTTSTSTMFPAASRYYTQYKGTRCALPLLADTYGLYYNKTLFKQAGHHGAAEDVLGARRPTRRS